MESSIPASTARPVASAYDSAGRETASSGISWGAALGGAFVAAALALILVLLGTGLGMTAVSPWANEGASAKTLGIAAALWLVLTHLASSAIGGYIAGRLRTKWVDVHTNEVFFRDTAHGLLAWSIGIVITAAFLTSAAASLVGGAAKVGATAVAAAGAGAGAAAGSQAPGKDDAHIYFLDSMFRSDKSFLALLIGAFTASFAATMGGKQRDNAVAVANRY